MSDPHSVLTDEDYARLLEALKRVNERLASVRATNEVIEAAKHPDGRRPKGGDGKKYDRPGNQ